MSEAVFFGAAAGDDDADIQSGFYDAVAGAEEERGALDDFERTGHADDGWSIIIERLIDSGGVGDFDSGQDHLFFELVHDGAGWQSGLDAVADGDDGAELWYGAAEVE